MLSVPFWMFVIGAGAIRVPLFFLLDLHPDEQTFLNVGQDVVLGHLPYLHTWDNKPPLLFFLIAPISLIAHHEIWIVRAFAAAFDILTSLLVKKIADCLFGEAQSNWISAVWCFAALTVRDGGGALMSETVALPFLMGATLFLCNERPTPLQGFVAGLLLGAATLIRASPVFPAVAVVVVLLVEGLVRRDGHLSRAGAFVALGGLCTLTLVTLPYVIVGETDMLVRSMVLAPRAYVQERGQSSMVKEIVSLAFSRSIGGALFFGLVGLIYGAVTRLRTAGLWRVAAMWLALLLGLSQAPEGAFYLILLMPFACIFAALAFSRLLAMPQSRLIRAALIVVLMVPVPLAAAVTIKRGRERSPMVDTLAMLSRDMKTGDTLYLTTDYLLYWLLERSPPHPIVTHAGNLFRPRTFGVLPYGMKTSADVMRAIVAATPTWIVFATDMSKYEQGTEVGQVLQPVLALQYDLKPSPPGRIVYRLHNPIQH